MLSVLDLRGFEGDLRSALPRPPLAGVAVVETVRGLLAAVRAEGDAALRRFTKQFDGCEVDDLRVPADQVAGALALVDGDLRGALAFAYEQIKAYHEAQIRPAIVHSREGISVRDLSRPVERAGVYVPGGRAIYPSTVLMCAVPARVAGVGEVVLCVPPGPDGAVPLPTLAAAALAGVDEVYRVGGAQAIAALAYGTESIRAVDMIVGPGNVYVTVAKREVAGVVGIEATAGPSELVIVADGSAVPDWIAIDLMAQAEHGPDGSAVLVTPSPELIDGVEASLARLVSESPRRAEIEATLQSGGRAVLVEGLARAMDVANAVAPEHLEVMTEDPESLLPLVRHAGAVFLGPFAPAAVGDYVAGANHVLPTNRTARFSSALRVDHFLRHVHVVSLGEDALRNAAPHVRALAGAEGLDAHAASVAMRTVAR